jgi:uncharacterized membrane protein
MSYNNLLVYPSLFDLESSFLSKYLWFVNEVEKSKKIKKTEDWENYKTTEKNAKREIEKAHREYTDKFLNLNASENPKKFYSYIKSKRSNTSRIPTLKENDNLLLSRYMLVS